VSSWQPWTKPTWKDWAAPHGGGCMLVICCHHGRGHVLSRWCLLGGSNVGRLWNELKANAGSSAYNVTSTRQQSIYMQQASKPSQEKLALSSNPLKAILHLPLTTKQQWVESMELAHQKTKAQIWHVPGGAMFYEELDHLEIRNGKRVHIYMKQREPTILSIGNSKWCQIRTYGLETRSEVAPPSCKCKTKQDNDKPLLGWSNLYNQWVIYL